MVQIKTLPKYLAPRDENPKNKKDFKYIPKKIFQTWETNKVSLGMYDAVYTWIDKNPDWEYHFFDKDDRRNFIKDNFPKKVLAAYDALIPGAYKADLWRYCVLYIHGGVYADIKLVLCNQLDKLIDRNTKFTSVKEISGFKRQEGGVLNSFLCSSPKHPFFKKAIESIVDNVNSCYFGDDALCPTGPYLLGNSINLILCKRTRSKFRSGFQKASGFEFTLWHLDRKSRIIYTDKRKSISCFTTRYSSYYKELSVLFDKGKKQHNYTYCWDNCVIYDSTLDRKKILYPVIKQVRKSYKNKNYKKARELILERFFKYKQFNLTLVRYIVKYEILVPILRFLRIVK